MNHAQRTAAYVRRFIREQRARLQVQAWLIAFDPHDTNLGVQLDAITKAMTNVRSANSWKHIKAGFYLTEIVPDLRQANEYAYRIHLVTGAQPDHVVYDDARASINAALTKASFVNLKAPHRLSAFHVQRQENLALVWEYLTHYVDRRYWPQCGAGNWTFARKAATETTNRKWGKVFGTWYAKLKLTKKHLSEADAYIVVATESNRELATLAAAGNARARQHCDSARIRYEPLTPTSRPRRKPTRRPG